MNSTDSEVGNHILLECVFPLDRVLRAAKKVELSRYIVNESDLHITLMYDLKTAHKPEVLKDAKLEPFFVRGTGWFSIGDKVALSIQSQKLRDWHRWLFLKGLHHSCGYFEPHLSVAYNLSLDQQDSLVRELNREYAGEFVSFIVADVKNKLPRRESYPCPPESK